MFLYVAYDAENNEIGREEYDFSSGISIRQLANDLNCLIDEIEDVIVLIEAETLSGWEIYCTYRCCNILQNEGSPTNPLYDDVIIS